MIILFCLHQRPSQSPQDLMWEWIEISFVDFELLQLDFKLYRYSATGSGSERALGTLPLLISLTYFCHSAGDFRWVGLSKMLEGLSGEACCKGIRDNIMLVGEGCYVDIVDNL